MTDEVATVNEVAKAVRCSTVKAASMLPPFKAVMVATPSSMSMVLFWMYELELSNWPVCNLSQAATSPNASRDALTKFATACKRPSMVREAGRELTRAGLPRGCDCVGAQKLQVVIIAGC